MKNWQKIQQNPAEAVDTIRKSNQINDTIREFFNKRDYLEVYTPILVAHPGMEPYLTPFETMAKNTQNQEFPAYLITSPEYSMKKLLAGGLAKIYQITPCFRNEENFGGRHNLEFLMLEWYQTNADYKVIMAEMAELLQTISQKLFNSLKFTYQNTEIDLSQVEYLSIKEAMLKFAQVNIDECRELTEIQKITQEKGYKLDANAPWDDHFFAIFLNEVEPFLGQGKLTFLYNYPKSMAALAKIKADDSWYAERFEAYINGLELANGFSELLNADEQLARLEEEQDFRVSLGKTKIAIDQDFIEALRSEIPPSGGVALGVSRLAMLFLNKKDINEVLLFPCKDLF
jgi:lysyl-tRNA synthetase class 2